MIITQRQNESSEYLVSELLNEKILSLFLLENILDVVSYENADSKIDIIIKSISDKPSVYSIDKNSEYEFVNEWKICDSFQTIRAYCYATVLTYGG